MNLDNYIKIIEEMYEQQENELIDVKEANSGIRNIRMAAIINDYLYRISGSKIIVTGGLSVEFYTRGNYTTQDIDFITPAEKELPKVLEDLGFKKKDKYWQHKKLEILLELVANTPFGGIYREPFTYTTKDGYEIYFSNVNDILMDRIRGLLHWGYKDYGKWILEIIELHNDELDFDYLKEQMSDDEINILNDFIEIHQDKSSINFINYSIKQKLEENDIVYSEKEENDIHYLAFPLNRKIKRDIGPYFGLLLKPYLGILMYNEVEDELIPADSIILTNLIEKYGEPFKTILKIIEEALDNG